MIKPLYNTKEIANRCFVQSQAILDWEERGLIPQAKKNGRYRHWTIEQVKEIIEFSDARYNTRREE